MAITVLLADDHPLVLDGLAALFGQEEDIEVVGRCRNGDETLAAVRSLKPDVVLLDIRMPGRDGMSVLKEIREQGIPTKPILLTASLREDQLLEATRLGARGVLLKEMAPRLVVECVRKVHAGGSWLEQRTATSLLERLARNEETRDEVSVLLTPRELEIVRMVAAGMRNKQVAERLFIAEGTVKVHLHNIYEKLELEGRLDLILFAHDKGLA
ncbi:MAG TPA: response regulator transcription factor [Thermoanaerobaculia bacterium]|nr:response regulator transcription factor [Thermoanaerobaculia bacterium]